MPVHASTRFDIWKLHQTIVLGLATTAQAHPSRPLFQTEYSLTMTHATAVEACTHAHYDKVARPVAGRGRSIDPLGVWHGQCEGRRDIPFTGSRPSPSSTRACSVSYNYAWEYFRRQKAWYILSRDACRDCHKASSCGAVT